MSLTRSLLLFIIPLLFIGASSYTIEGLYPDAGPTTGYTRVTIYTPYYLGMNYSTYPHPKCQFGNAEPLLASWIHCYGQNKEDSTRDATCLSCESPPHSSGDAKVKVTIKGDFTDTVESPFYFYTPPEVHWAEPFIGMKPGGTIVTVHGAHFENLPALGCVFGTKIVPARLINSNLLTCRSPESEVVDTPIPLKVTQNIQQSSTTSISYYYYSVPEISQLVPNNGPTTGGTEVYIKGRQMYPFQTENLDIANTTFVMFGNGHYMKATLINTTHAKCISPPALTEGAVVVELTFNDQEWTNDGILFYYYAPPYVLELIPNFGAVEGGTNVTVIGASFWESKDIKCRFGTNVVPGHYIDPTKVWCITPKAPKSGYVDFGLALTQDRYSGTELKYLYIDPPVITSISPLCGPTTGFTQLTIIGKNFVYIGVNKALCVFGETHFMAATVVNETLIYCDSPSVVDRFGNNVNNTWSLPLKLTLNQVDYFSARSNFTYYVMPSVELITPNNGPISGGTHVIAFTQSNITSYCQLTCRFGTMEVPANLTAPNQLTCASPAVTCPGETVVQISLNKQQYTSNLYDMFPTVFYYYQRLVVAYITPESIPTTGGSIITIFGEGFLMSKNTTIWPNGKPGLGYLCRFIKSDSKTNLGVVNATYADNNVIKCPSPVISTPTDYVDLQISPNGQNWEPVAYKKLSFYKAPEVASVDPKFGKIKQKDGKLEVYGKNFDCLDPQCTDLRCAFTSPDFRVITDGVRIDSTHIICNIPPISRPEVTTVSVTLNGIDYTTQIVNYTFYDAFVLSIDPPYVPVEGNTIARVRGYGFADTGHLKVRLWEPVTNTPLACNGNPCVLPATFVSQQEIQFKVPPMAQVSDINGTGLNFRPFVAEVSVYDDTFTNNGVEIQYFEQPTVGSLTIDGSPKIFHKNSLPIMRIPVTIRIPQGTTRATFLNFAKIRCRFELADETQDTVGIIVNYPYPTDQVGLQDSYTRIECPSPQLTKTGNGKVSISLNGRDFVGNSPITVKPELKLLSVAPQCGPKEGGTKTTMSVQGFDDGDFNRLFFSWSTVCTELLVNNSLIAKNTLATVTPPVPYVEESPGGTSLAVFSVVRYIDFSNGTELGLTRNYLDSSAEFLYYRTPVVVHMYPHSGLSTGGTPILIEGGFFFTDPLHSCTPKCKFGNEIVEAEYISTVRIRCISPAHKEGAIAPLTITMNGHDETVVIPDQTFTWVANPAIFAIHPSSGPTSGGTSILVQGQKFVDLSRYPDEFLCKFSSNDRSMPPKTTPAKYLNESTIVCTSPGGWGAGTIARVQITYNGIDYSNDNNTFRFYQVDTIRPVSGPATGGTNITILGSGFDYGSKVVGAACRIGQKTSQATFVNWTHIICESPPADSGPNYYGHEEFYYTLDGRDWHKIIQGFTYYQQPIVSQVIPAFIPRDGGIITVVGERFIPDYAGTSLTCKIGNTVVLATYINKTHLNCTFNDDIDSSVDGADYLQVALNNASYTPKTPSVRMNVFYITKMSPQSGVIQGGTQIHIEGVNFPEGSIPLCRFGIKHRSAITYGTLISNQQLMCTSPPADPPSMADYPLEIMFSLNFDSDTYRTWAWEGLHYYYYQQPEIISVSPRSGLLDHTTMVNITSSQIHRFNDSIIGSLVTNDVRFLSTEIVCKFGRFGSTKGVMLTNEKISCPTPNTKINLEEVGEENVKVEVAMNGQDFENTRNVYFKFVGTKSPTNYGLTWIIAIIIGSIVLLFLLYFIMKAFSGAGSGVNVDPSQSAPKVY